MTNFFTIFINILLPIFIQIGIGFIVQKRFKLDIKTLTRVQIYIFIPALIFQKIYTSTLEKTLISQIVVFTLFIFFSQLILSKIIARVTKTPRSTEMAFVNGVTLRNMGNYGIPLITLLFQSDFALSVHMIVMLTTNLLTSTVGLYNASGSKLKGVAILKQLTKMPIIYAILIGFLFRGVHLSIGLPLEATIDILAQGVVPLALFTLGAQLCETKIQWKDKLVLFTVFFRLILSPLMAFVALYFLNWDPTVSKILIVGAAAPSAVNSVLLAIEFDGDSEFASQTVFLSTLLSGITMTVLIMLLF